MSFQPESGDNRIEQVESFSDSLAHLLSLRKPKIIVDNSDQKLPQEKLGRTRKMDGVYKLTFSKQSFSDRGQNLVAHEVAHAFIHENNQAYDAMDTWFEKKSEEVLSKLNNRTEESSETEISELINTLFVLSLYEETAATLVGFHFSNTPPKPLDNRFLSGFNESSYTQRDGPFIGRLHVVKEIASQMGMHIGESLVRQSEKYSGYGFDELSNNSMKEFLCMNPIDFVKKTLGTFPISRLGFTQTISGIEALEKRFSEF